MEVLQAKHRLPKHANTIRAPVRPKAGPPSPFKSTKRRGAALTLTRRACTSTMQRPAQHSTPTTTDALSVNEDNTPSPEGSWNTVSANRKPASSARSRSELITIAIQLPPETLTPKLPLYDLLSTIIATANLSPKTSAEVTLQAVPAQSLVFLKTHSPLTAHLLLSLTSLEPNAFQPSAAAVRLLYQQIPTLTFVPNPGASIAKSKPTHLSTPPAPTF
ncbi:hypothetical protein HPB51_009553 [Rhipicephalus microplus]|uniref:Uncharacterized protein n=1 Tax=Rhipicephalus microplus TaxID=6941 RepID=A0A9J6F0Z3_RHIMP|nr:hypothetical protein HPB51_009553 [Rhipicephalus microplus]